MSDTRTSPPALSPTMSTSSASSGDSSTSSPPPSTSKRVSFCPLALLIGVAGEGEVEQAMVQAAQQQMGRRKVAVRTYSCVLFSPAPPRSSRNEADHPIVVTRLEAPNLGEVAGKAWHSVVNGFTASLEPFLHSGAGAGGQAAGVCSASRARDSSPQREREVAISRSTSRSRSRSPSPGTQRGRSTEPAFVKGQWDDPAFVPNSPTRLKLRLPTLKRECSHPGGALPCGKPILRRPSISSPPVSPVARSTSPSALPAFPTFDSSTTVSSSTTTTSSTPSTFNPRVYPTLSRTPSRPAPSQLHPTAGLIVPLQPCCRRCEAATMYGASLCDGGSEAYEEHWSKGAKKQREEEQARRAEREGWARNAKKIAAKYEGGAGLTQSETVEEKEAREAEEEARASRLGRIAAQGGDVDDLAERRRHSSLSSERSVASSATGVGEEQDGMQDIEVIGVVEPARHSDPGAATAGEDALIATVISEEPSSMELENDVADLLSSAGPHSSPSSPPPSSTSNARPPISVIATHHTEPSNTASCPALPSSATTTTDSPSASSTTSRPPKRRLSSAAAASAHSLSSTHEPQPTPSLSFSQRLTSLGASFLHGASAGMGGVGGGGGGVRAG
ncbi:hypothetical protein JCM11251_007567 [Rhodosporidiobolus azoricus]